METLETIVRIDSFKLTPFSTRPIYATSPDWHASFFRCLENIHVFHEALGNVLFPLRNGMNYLYTVKDVSESV
jgi:hypothetical protein